MHAYINKHLIRIRTYTLTRIHIYTLHTQEGWPMSADTFNARKSVFEQKGRFSHVTVAGSHHCHLDPHTRQETADTILTFLQVRIYVCMCI